MSALSLLTVVAAAPAGAAPAGIVTFTAVGGDGIHDQVPVTFGAVFAKGDVPSGASVVAVDRSGNELPSQIDVKAKHPDGSLRHAVVTVIVPHLSSDQEFPLTLIKGAAKQTPPLNVSDLPADFDATVDLTVDGQHLVASARDLLTHTKPQFWLSGSLATEWWVSGPLRNAQGSPDPHLSARFGIRSYGKGRPVRVEVNVENTTTMVPGRRVYNYDARISMGGKTVFEMPGLRQWVQTRWRKVFWWQGPVDVYVKHDLAYLKKARVIPNYSPHIEGLSDDVSAMYAHFAKADHSPLASGIITAYMPMTGGRGDIAPLPSWTALYLLTMDKRAYEMTMEAGDLSGSFASHFRNDKTDRPATSEDYPNLTTHSNYVGRPGYLEKPITDGKKNPLTPQSAHEPSLAFIPYLVTGDRYYLEELQFWSQWNAWTTAPEYRNHQEGLYSWDEIRGQAWSIRTLAQAAYITPDSDPLKPVLQRELVANFRFYDKTYTRASDSSPLHNMIRPGQHKVAEYSPWMDDYVTWAVGYTAQLGFDFARPFATWKATYPVQRMINPDYCWIMATTYRLIGQNPDGSLATSWKDAYKYTFEFTTKSNSPPPDNLQCGGDEMASLLKLKEAGEMAGGAGNPGGYASNMQPALAAAVDLGVPGARQAWEKFQARPVKPKTGVAPQWDILPWSDAAQ